MGGVAAATGEDHRVGEVGRTGRSEAYRDQPGLAWVDGEGIAGGDLEGRGGGDGAAQGLAAVIDQLERLGVRLTDDHRSEAQAGRAEREQRWRVGDLDVVDPSQGVGTDWAGDSQRDRVGGCRK